MNRLVTLLGRALRRRCPECGGAGIFRTWFAMHPACPHCSLTLDRGEPGYQVGAYMLNIAVSEGIAVGVLVVVAVATWPTPPWDGMLWGGVALMIAAPIIFYPFAKTLFLALDLFVRPRGKE